VEQETHHQQHQVKEIMVVMVHIISQLVIMQVAVAVAQVHLEITQSLM
jgi:hypothetical protein